MLTIIVKQKAYRVRGVILLIKESWATTQFSSVSKFGNSRSKALWFCTNEQAGLRVVAGSAECLGEDSGLTLCSRLGFECYRV